MSKGCAPSMDDVRSWVVGPEYAGGPVNQKLGEKFDLAIAAHDQELREEVAREAKAEELRSAASELDREVVRHLGPFALIQDIGYQDGVRAATKRIRSRADRIESGEL